MTNKMNSQGWRFTLTIMLCLLFVSASTAQTVRYKTESRVKLHMLGKIGSMIGNKPQTSEIFVNAQHMLSNDGKRTSTIFSIPESKFSTLDHKKKTYYDITFDEMASMFDGMQESAHQQMSESEVNPDDIEFSVSVEDMGGSEKIAGYKADRKLLRIDMTLNTEATDDEGNVQTASGKFYAVSEVWVSQDAPGNDIMMEFGQNYFEPN